MTYLVLGLVLFLGVHSVRIFANDWRTTMRNKLGATRWRTWYSVVSLLGLSLLVWGFGVARQSPVQWWIPPIGMKHLASLLTLLAFVLLASAYVPGNHIKVRVHHPMAAAVKLWALAHLLANGNAAHVLLFGSFLIWSVLSLIAARRRDRLESTQYLAGHKGSTGVTVALGVAAWIAFTLWLHGLLIGVRPFG
jgi:uncharacterized membrane protein